MVAITVSACQKESKKDFSETEFFDIHEYAIDFCKIHQKSPTLIQILNTEEEMQELEKDSSTLQFIRTMCKKANIDNPTLYDKYAVSDTLINGMKVTNYNTLDDNLLVKQISVTRRNEAIKSVTMKTSYGNLMSETEKVIQFFDSGKIQMETHTASKLSEDIQMSVVWNLE